jgi:hypothetical protein
VLYSSSPWRVLTINRKTAETLGLTIRLKLFVFANEMIE